MPLLVRGNVNGVKSLALYMLSCVPPHILKCIFPLGRDNRKMYSPDGNFWGASLGIFPFILVGERFFRDHIRMSYE